MDKEDGVKRAFVVVSLIVMDAAQGALTGAPASARTPTGPVNIDVSQRAGNESEETVAVNPRNPKNIVIVTNIAEGVSGMFAAVSFDGGQTWARRIIGNND